MPTTWWGKSLGVFYVGGYWLYVVAAAIYAWPTMGFSLWCGYVSFQFFYAAFWPILVALQLFGVRW